ncbi:MAG: choice-of-anchor G family protein [Leucobacter sp.]|nr:choice-of-anchor G family protein [Leucobacter sp.]
MTVLLTKPSNRRTPHNTIAAVSALSVGALIVLGSAVPAAASSADPIESTTQYVVADGVNLAAADLAGTYASSPGGPSIDTAAFDAAVFSSLTDQIALLRGGNARVPLVFDAAVPQGLLAVNQSDIVGYSSAPNDLGSFAANGAVNASTGEFTDLASGGSTVNLAAAFDGLGVSPATRAILSQIELQVGTVASKAEAGPYFGASGDYRLEGLQLDLQSPLLVTLPDLVDAALQEATALAAAALEAVAPGGIIPLPAGTLPDVPVYIGTLGLGDVELQVTAPNFDAVVSDVMNAPGGVVVVSDDGVATVNLNTGEITIDLALLFGGDVNGLLENTEVFTSANMASISSAVANALSKTTGIFAGGIVNALHATQLGLSVDVTFTAAPNPVTPNLNNLVVATGTLTGSGSLDDFANGSSLFTSSLVQAPGLPACAGPVFLGLCAVSTSTVVGGAIVAVNAAVPTVAPPAVQAVAAPLLEALEQAEAQVIAEVEVVVADVYQRITSAFDGLMPGLATVVINEQSTPGDLGDYSFTVRAVGVTLLPNFPLTNRAHIGLASSTVLALADPSSDIVEAEVKPGSALTVQGAGWNPSGGWVAISFVDAENNPVGDVINATVAPDGTISQTWIVPSSAHDGVLTMTAVQEGLTRTDTVSVVTPVVPPTPIDPKPALPDTGADSSLMTLGVAGMLRLTVGAGVAVVARTQQR